MSFWRIAVAALTASALATAVSPPSRAAQAGAGGAAAQIPQGTYRYAMSAGGSTIGSSTIVVERSGGTVSIGESATMGGTSLVSHRSLDATTFATLAYQADASGKHLVASFEGNSATLAQGTASASITAAPGAPFFVNDNMVAGFAQVPATLEVTAAKQLTLACVCAGFVSVLANVLQAAAPARPAGVPADDDVVTISMEGAVASLWFDPKTAVLDRLDLPSQQFTIVRQSYAPAVIALPRPVEPTPLPLPPAHYRSSDANVTADDGVALAATLTMPGGAAGSVPAFVFIHGSGCIDRDETIGPNKVFAQLANRLSNDGYAVLRYDKRSCGKSGGTFATRDRLVADALDAVAYLRAQRGVDPKRIYVLGHSEGGELAPSVAIADGHLAGIVLLAPPAIPLEQILMQQALRLATPSDRATIAQKEQQELDAIADGGKTGAGNAWLRSSFGIDPAALIAKVPCPILIVQGGGDIQVLAADTPRLVSAARAANRTVTVAMLDRDDHLFIQLKPGGNSTTAEYYIPAYLDPALFDAIEAWLASLRGA